MTRYRECKEWFVQHWEKIGQPVILICGFGTASLYFFMPGVLKDNLVTNMSPPDDSDAHHANRIYDAHFHSEAVFIAVMTYPKVAGVCMPRSPREGCVCAGAGCADYAVCGQLGHGHGGVRFVATRRRTSRV